MRRLTPGRVLLLRGVWHMSHIIAKGLLHEHPCVQSDLAKRFATTQEV